MAAATLVFTSATGEASIMFDDSFEVVALAPLDFDVEPEPHCFVCRRHTDHFAEHDNLVELGVARYDTRTGDVERVTDTPAAVAFWAAR